LFSVWFALTLSTGRGVRSGLLWLLLPFALVGLVGLGWFGVLPLALASIVLIISCLVFSVDSICVSWISLLKRLVAGVVLVVAFVEAAALVFFNAPFVLNLPVEASAAAVHWRMVELSLSNIAYPILPYVYLSLVIFGVTAFLWKALSVTLADRWKLPFGWAFGVRGRLRCVVENCKAEACMPFVGRFPLSAAFFVSVVVFAVLVVITVLPWINPTYHLVSVDAPGYYEWLARMRGLDVGSALSFAFANDRAAFLILDYLLSFAMGSLNVVQFMAVLLVPLLFVASLFVMRRVCNFRDTWVCAMLVAPFSVPALGLIYSGYFANMLAVVFVYFSFVLLLTVFRSGSALGVCGLLGASLVALFAHSWTWYIFAMSLCAFLFWEWRLAVRDRGLWRRFRWKVDVVVVIISAGLVCDLTRKLLMAPSVSVAAFETAKSSLGFPDVGFVLGGLRLTTNFYLGGVFASGLFVVLCFVGFLFLLSFKSEMSRLLVSWIFVACAPVLFASGEFVFNRFLFLMPWVVFSGLGLSFFIRFGVCASKESRAKKLGFELLVVGLVFLVLLNFGLRYVSNMNVV